MYFGRSRALLLVALAAGCGGGIESSNADHDPDRGIAESTHRVQGTLMLTTGDASGPDRPRTAPLASTRVFLVPLVSCESVHGRTLRQLEASGIGAITSTYSREDGGFELVAPRGVYSFFADYEGRPEPRSSGRGECNRVDVEDVDVLLPAQRTKIDVSM